MKRIVAFCFAALLAAGLLAGCSTKANYSTTSSATHWEASYQRLNGEDKKTVTIPEGATVKVTVTTESGYLDVWVDEPGGQSAIVPYQGSSVNSPEDAVVETSFVAEKGGEYTITLTAGDHRGGFSFEW